MSAEPVKTGDKWFVNRDPDEISHYVADITQELIDRATTPLDGAGAVELLLVGVVKLADPEVQVITVAGVSRTYVVAFLGGTGSEPPADWHWSVRVSCKNGERFDKTTWFKKVET